MLYTAHNINTLKRLSFANILFREINLGKDLFSLMKIMYFTFTNKVNLSNFGLFDLNIGIGFSTKGEF